MQLQVYSKTTLWLHSSYYCTTLINIVLTTTVIVANVVQDGYT